MNLAELHQKLIAAARTCRPSERVPYAFEKRIMARLLSQPLLDKWSLWSRGLWRAVAPCLAVMLLLGVWAHFDPTQKITTRPARDLSQELENTVLAAVYQDTGNNSW